MSYTLLPCGCRAQLEGCIECQPENNPNNKEPWTVYLLLIPGSICWIIGLTLIYNWFKGL